MCDVLLGQSYYLRFDPKLWAEMKPYPPLGSLYAAGCLRRDGLKVAFFDAMLANSEQEWDQELELLRPRFAILYEDNFNYLSKMCLSRMRTAAMTMIIAAHERDCTVIVCGADASDHADVYLKGGADFVLVGEGEATLSELIAVLTEKSDKPLQEIASLAFSDKDDGSTVYTPKRAVIKDLDSLPRPAWDLADLQRYKKIWRRRHGFYSINMVTSRGCPYHCNWCAKPIWGQRYHARSPDDVVAELKWLYQTYQPDHVWFMDDMMGIKPGWLSEFADGLEREGIRIPFKCLNRVDLLLRDGEIDALRRAGCQTVWTGVESGSQRILDAMDKGTSIEQVRVATRQLHRAGIEVGYFIQFGYPGETREDIDMTFRLVREERPDQIGVSVSYPLPGTRFYEAVKNQLGEKRNWTDSDDLDILYLGAFDSAFYRKLHRVLHKEFRSRKAADRLREGVRHPSTLGTGHLREAAVMAYHSSTLPFARRQMERLSRKNHKELRELPDLMDAEAAATPSPY